MSNVLILRAPGTNCDLETAYAFELAGAKQIDILHINRVLEQPDQLRKAQILCIPGGFSFGDDIAAGRIFASKLRHRIGEELLAFRDAGKLILGICNGFQVLLKTGLLFEEDDNGPMATLTWNSSAMYTDRWVHLESRQSHCVFLRNIQSLYLPIAHAEGRFVPRSENELANLEEAGQLPLHYTAADNPNGSTLNVAGACDSTGRIFGLMPHPERYVDAVQHPHWTRRHDVKTIKGQALPGDGLALFKNAVDYFK